MCEVKELSTREDFKSQLLNYSEQPLHGGEYIASIGIHNFTEVRLAVGFLSMERFIHRLAERLCDIKSVVSVGRLNQDSLVLIFECPEGRSLRDLLSSVQRQVGSKIDVGDGVLSAETSIGYCQIVPEIGVEKLMQRVEMAMDQARHSGNTIWRFSEEEISEARNRLSLMSEVRHALAADKFSFAYQPQVNARSGKVTGLEALLRWEEAPEGFPGIGEMIKLSEKTGDILAITIWTFYKVFQDFEAFEELGIHTPISINVSGVVLSEKNFAKHILRKATKYKDRLVLEVTETALIESPHYAVKNLEELSNAGFRFSLDDYGTGYSSLEKMRSIPVSELKIDASFVRDLATSHHNPLIVRSTIDLAHALELEVVAEGVEDAETMALLSVMGCDIVQGYFIGKPMPFEAVVLFLQEGSFEETLKEAQSPFALFS